MKELKRVFKLILITIISTIILTLFNIANTYAIEEVDTIRVSNLSIESIFTKGNTFINTGSAEEKISISSAEEEFLPVGQILVVIANGVVIIVVAIMGIRWITANPEQQGKLKQQLIGLVVSIVVIYGAVGIWSLIKSFMEGLPI